MSRTSTAVGGRFRTTIAISAALVASLLGTVGLAVPSGAATAVPMSHHNPICHQATGTFTSPALTITDVTPDPTIPNLYHYTASGGDHWSGTLTGDTKYQGPGTVDLVTGEVQVDLHEVFIGTVDGFGSGKLRLSDHVSAFPPGLPTVDTAVTGGHGEIARVRGGLYFQTTEVTNPDPYGNGDTAGTYSGMLCR